MNNKWLFLLVVTVVLVLFFSAFQQRPVENGLGDVRYSVLKPAVFEKLNPGWKHMAGQAMEENWELYKLYNDEGLLEDNLYGVIRNNLPDGRGLFLRGMNDGRADGKGDPSNDRKIADYQADEFKEHNHDYRDMRNSDDVESDNSDERAAGTSDHDPLRTTGNRGGAETRPRNISLYIYIKVN